MDIREAFAAAMFAPPGATGEERARCARACSVLYEALRALARKHLDIPGSLGLEADDLAGAVFVNLAASGPREADRCPRAEALVLGYLRRCLVNKLTDELHRRGRASEVEDRAGRERLERPPEEEQEQARRAQAQELELERRRRELVELERVVVGRVAPRAREELGREALREAFDVTFGELRRYCSGEVDMPALIGRERERSGTGAAGARVRDKIYKRFSRVRERLLLAIGSLREEGSLKEDEAEVATRYVENRLKRRQTPPDAASW